MDVFIKQDLLTLILNLSKNYYPNEFIALLRGEIKENKKSNKNKKVIIRELLFVPGAIFGDNFSSIDNYNLPFYKDIVGTVHSHPNRSYKPSDADINFFKSYYVNLIVKFPYSCIEDVKCYYRNGKIINLLIV